MTLPVECRDRFIESLTETGNVCRSAEAAGVSRLTAYRWRDGDPDFARAWDLALEVARQGLRERVVETAAAVGLGRWAPVLDPITGEPLLDDDFEPLLRLEVGHVDARVLMKWMDKTLSDSPTRIEQRTALLGASAGGTVEVVFVESEDGRPRHPLGPPETEAEDAEFEEVGEG